MRCGQIQASHRARLTLVAIAVVAVIGTGIVRPLVAFTGLVAKSSLRCIWGTGTTVGYTLVAVAVVATIGTVGVRVLPSGASFFTDSLRCICTESRVWRTLVAVREVGGRVGVTSVRAVLSSIPLVASCHTGGQRVGSATLRLVGSTKFTRATRFLRGGTVRKPRVDTVDVFVLVANVVCARFDIGSSDATATIAGTRATVVTSDILLPGVVAIGVHLTNLAVATRAAIGSRNTLVTVSFEAAKVVTGLCCPVVAFACRTTHTCIRTFVRICSGTLAAVWLTLVTVSAEAAQVG